jgi:cytochrome c oxidase cbb3-type subunit I/II
VGTPPGLLHGPDALGRRDRVAGRGDPDVPDQEQRRLDQDRQPYTPLELAGRDIYVSEGCYNCHSQMIRPMLAETERYGEYSKPGESVYDRPFQWGSRRIGPDLAREGVTRPQASWHFRHFLYPRDVVKDTVMPPFPWLVDRKLDLDKIPRRVQAAIYLGAEYDESQTGEGAIASALAQGRAIAESIEADGDAKADDLANDKDIREVIALIAYLQRLGTDIYKTPEPAEAENDSPDDSTLGAR